MLFLYEPNHTKSCSRRRVASLSRVRSGPTALSRLKDGRLQRVGGLALILLHAGTSVRIPIKPIYHHSFERFHTK
jgi:hypothetical protein